MSDREIFFEALEMPTPEARAAYLQGACGRDVTLRRKVDELLKEHFSNDSLLAGPALEEERTAEVKLPSPEAPAQMLGRYKLLEKIGEGGFGEVWMAEQREPVKRRVALKLIKLGMDSRQIVARFEAERQALAMMDHANIAKIFDADVTDTGRPYFVMELVRGIKITEYCDQNQLPTQERLDLFIIVCQAIQHAHQKGIIHRDIKPSNILVTLHDGVPVPKVIDFGIAKATQQELTDKTVFTQFQQFIGTPAYISPEQAEMSGLDIDTRADIYSLGVLLYELLVDQTPFDAKEMMQGGLDALRQIIREKEPLRPSTKLNTLPGDARTTAGKRRQTDVGKLVHQLQGDLDWIVMKCLEKDRTRRYETANGLASDIQRHLNDEAVLARPPGAAYRFQKLVRRNKLVFAAGTAVATALVLAVIVSTWHAVRATRSQENEAKHRQIADEARQNEARLRAHAEAQELTARQRAYASDINLVQQALVINNLGNAQELLNRQRPKPGESDLRGWEWRYLWQQCRSDALFTVCQLKHSIMSLAVSADEKLIAACEDFGGGLSIFDVKTRQLVARMSVDLNHGRVAFSPRDNLLAYTIARRQSHTNSNYAIRLWNGETRENVRDLPLESECAGMAFSRDGRTLVTSTTGKLGEIALWQIPNGKKLVSFPVSRDDLWLSTFALAEDLSLVAYMKYGPELHVFDLVNGQDRWIAKASDEGAMALALSPDGKILVTGSGFAEPTIRLWDVATGKEIRRLEGHRSFIAALKFWPDGKMLASASGDQTIRLWDLADLKDVPPPRVLRGHKSEVHMLELLPRSEKLISGCKDGSVYLWDATSNSRQSARITLPGKFSSWRFEAGSTSVVALARSGVVGRWKGAGFQEMEVLLGISTNFDAHATLISGNAQLLAASSPEGRLSIWDLRRSSLLREWTNGVALVPFAFLADGKQLLTTYPRGRGGHHRWDLTTGKEMEAWDGMPLHVPAWIPSISPDEHFCLTLKFGSAASIKDLKTGIAKDIKLSLTELSGASFSANGKLLAMSFGEGAARLLEMETLQELATFRGVLLGTDSVAFSPDSKRLAVGSSGTEAMKVWDVLSGQELLTLEGQGSNFSRTSFSPDGNVLGSMSEPGVLHLWRAPSWEEIAAAEAKEKTQRPSQTGSPPIAPIGATSL